MIQVSRHLASCPTSSALVSTTLPFSPTPFSSSKLPASLVSAVASPPLLTDSLLERDCLRRVAELASRKSPSAKAHSWCWPVRVIERIRDSTMVVIHPEACDPAPDPCCGLVLSVHGCGLGIDHRTGPYPVCPCLSCLLTCLYPARAHDSCPCTCHGSHPWSSSHPCPYPSPYFGADSGRDHLVRIVCPGHDPGPGRHGGLYLCRGDLGRDRYRGHGLGRQISYPWIYHTSKQNQRERGCGTGICDRGRASANEPFCRVESDGNTRE